MLVPLKESEGKVLLALLVHDTPIMTLPKEAKLGSSAVYNSVRWLSERGLVAETREKEAPRRRMIGLTEKGQKIATMLQQIEETLS